jgi:hypothetical protein
VSKDYGRIRKENKGTKVSNGLALHFKQLYSGVN